MNIAKMRKSSGPARSDVQTGGFTIVELLVVIVVIGILAAITIVAYTGISQKASIAGLQSDLTNGATKLKLYYTEYGVYPDSPLNGSNCPSGTVNPADAKYCLKFSPGDTYTYTSTSPYKTFTLTATNSNGVTYIITESTAPSVLPPVVASGGTVTYTDSSGLNPRSSPSYPGGYTIQTFTISGTLTVTTGGNVSYLVVAGGGGSAVGGGGAGGYLSGTDSVSPGVISITVGSGGTSGTYVVSANNGTNSVFRSHTAIGGGGGSTQCYYGSPSAGGSGGGGGLCGTGGTSGAAGTAGQGNSGGGNGGFYGGGCNPNGGGGGAGGVGGDATSCHINGIGGVGLVNGISGTSITYAIGGNGGDVYNDIPGTNGTNGLGNGANGGGSSGPWGIGGSGVVIIRYKT